MKFIHSFFFILLTLAAFLLPKNLVIASSFEDTIYAANATFNKQDFSQATDLFIKGYWELRKVLTDIWYEADPIGNHNSIAFNGKYEPIRLGRFSNPRGYISGSNIWLGCWLNNSLLRQKIAWYHPTSCGLCGTGLFGIYYKGKSKSNIIKKKFVATFESENICCIRDAGNWLQFSFCKPVSQLLLKRFESSPKNAHDLLQILELYKCYIECDCGGLYQIRFAQANYDTVYRAFYPWFKNLILQQLTLPDNPIQTALISIFHHCDEKMPNFLDTESLAHEQIRGLGGYQIEFTTIINRIANPNNEKVKISASNDKALLLWQTIATASDKCKNMLQLAEVNELQSQSILLHY